MSITLESERFSTFSHLLVIYRRFSFSQKQPFAGVLQNYCWEVSQNSQEDTYKGDYSLEKLQAKAININTRGLNRSCFSVTLGNVLKTAFSQNDSGWLLLHFILEVNSTYQKISECFNKRSKWTQSNASFILGPTIFYRKSSSLTTQKWKKWLPFEITTYLILCFLGELFFIGRKGNFLTIRTIWKINVQKNTMSIWNYYCLDNLVKLEKSYLNNGKVMSMGKIKSKLLLCTSQKGLMNNKHFIAK